MAGHRLHVLGEHQLLHLVCAPLQLLQAVRSDDDEDVHVIEVLIPRKPLFQEIAGADGAVQVVEVRVGVGGVLDFGAVDSQLLSQLLLDAVLGLAVKEDVHVDPLACVDQQGDPPGAHLLAVAIGGHQEVGVVGAVHDDVAAMGVVDVFRRDELHGGDVPDLVPPARVDVLPDDLVDAHAQRLCRAGLTVQDAVEHLRRHLVLVVRGQKFIPALLQVGLSRPYRSRKGGDGVAFLIPPVCGERLVLEDDEEAPCDGLPGAYAPYQTLIILLQGKASPSVSCRISSRSVFRCLLMSAHLVRTLNWSFTGLIFR